MHGKGSVVILKDRTIEELGVDPSTISETSHQEIYVRCLRCSEEFKRERRHLVYLHHCPIYIGGKQLKWCDICRRFRSYEDFLRNDIKADKLSIFCKDCIEYVDIVSDNYSDTISDIHLRPRIEYKLAHQDAKVPYRKRVTDAGYDLSSIEDVLIPPRGFANISTGIILSAPEGWYYTIEGRSSMWKRGIMVFSGTIDSNYCDVVFAGLYNLKDEEYRVQKGDRIAQMVLRRLYSADFVEVKEFGMNYSQRGTDGWGSSGR